ncbi:N-6 DNA methylase [Streptomyces sp. NPDC058052]|uniref:N-6 DNA methylase n=1 Tax=Streptomyces sp. NPDC058052 TaxID=3346316 RepID=UPI0036E7A97E
MPQPTAQVTAAEISRIAGVTRATVSNWRRRHDDFPAPAGGTESSPLYDLEAVRGWLAARGQTTAANPAEELRTALRLHARGDGTTALLPLVLDAARRPERELAALGSLPDDDLASYAREAARALDDTVTGATTASRFTSADAPAVRALLRCVREADGETALSVLAERELEDSAASGTYQTPEPLADLASRLMPGAVARVLDPACGSGTLLAAAGRRGATRLYGQDALPVQALRGAVGLMLAAPEAEVTVRTGDSLRSDAFPALLADAVLCNPPYGDRDWGHDELAYDPRWAYGVPARAESELAWVQHCLAHLEPGGHAVLVLPPATASRASGRRVRAELVRSGALRAVAALPAGAAAPLHIGLQLWVLQRPEPGGADRSSVLFVDTAEATGEETTGRTHPRGGGRTALDWPAVTSTVLSHWGAFLASPDSFVDEPGIARTVQTIDLLDDLVDLTPARQVRASRAEVDPLELAGRVDAARGDLVRAAASLGESAQRGEWHPVGHEVREWRTATAADLARGGALTLLRTAPDGRAAGRPTGPVLTGPDIARGAPPSGDATELRTDTAPVVALGDVLVRGVAGGHGAMVRVARETDAGALLGHQVHLFRPDPARLDPWFLAGFLETEENLAGASTGSTILHVSPGRLRVPLLPLEEQRRYGEAFRRVHALRAEAQRAAHLAEETARLLTGGLTGGALLPPVAPDSA